MDPLTQMLVMAGVSAIPALFSNQSSPPDQPAPNYPDADLLNEFGATNDWINMLRSQWGAEFYGGKAGNYPINTTATPYDPYTQEFMDTMLGQGKYNPEDYGMEPLSPAQQASLAGSNVPMPKKRWEATYTGTKPAAKFLASQSKVYGDSDKNFGGELENYLKARGIESGDVVSGTQAELRKDYEQKAREIASKSNDIYVQTLGNLFGEVSDAGQQAAQLSGLTGQASAQWGNEMDRRYQQQMALWGQAQNMPPNQWAQAAGTMLPYLAMGMMGGGGTPPPYYGSAQTYYPGQTAMGYMG